MTQEQFNAMLEETGYPVAYDPFPREEEPSLPYITFNITRAQNFYADNMVYYSRPIADVTLLTVIKSPEKEKVLTDVLDNNGITWNKIDEAFEDDESASVYAGFFEVYL